MQSMKTPIVYSTRYDATAGNSMEIAEVLRGEGFKVKIVNRREERVGDISEFELVILGGGLQTRRLTSETKDLLKKFQKELSQKKVAVFIFIYGINFRAGRQDRRVEQNRAVSLEDKPAEYGLKPIAANRFGCIVDFDKIGILPKKPFWLNENWF